MQKESKSKKLVMALVGVALLATGFGLKLGFIENYPIEEPSIKEPEKEEKKLETPSGLVFVEDQQTLIFDRVANANNGYTVVVNGTTYFTKENKVKLEDFQLDAENLHFEVVANASGDYLQSDPAVLDFALTNEKQLNEAIYKNCVQGVQKALDFYAQLSSATGFSVNKIDCVSYADSKFTIYASNGNAKMYVFEFDLSDTDLVSVDGLSNIDSLKQLKQVSDCLQTIDITKICNIKRIAINDTLYQSECNLLFGASKNNSQIADFYEMGYTVTPLFANNDMRYWTDGSVSSIKVSGLFACTKGTDKYIIYSDIYCKIDDYYKAQGLTLEEALEQDYTSFTTSDTYVCDTGVKYKNYLDSIEQNLDLIAGRTTESTLD